MERRIKAYQGDLPYVFISYAHKDDERVLPIIAYLQQQGYPVWFDEGIDPGTEWDKIIAQHVKACRCMIAMISHAYLDSDNCLDELNYARDLKKDRLLIYLEDATLPDGIAMRHNRWQAIYQFRYTVEAEFYDKLMTAVVLQGMELIAQPAAASRDAYELTDDSLLSPEPTMLPRLRRFIQDKELPPAPPAPPAEEDEDPVLVSAIELALAEGHISIILMQRRLGFGYARASRVMDELEKMGIVGPADGVKPRKCLISRQEWSARAAKKKGTRSNVVSFIDTQLRGTEIGNRYRLAEKAGQGENAIVYKAYDQLTRRLVALKLYDQGTAKDIPLLNKPELRVKLQDTTLPVPALLQATLQMTQPVPRGSIAPKGCSAYIATEYVEGKTIAQLCREGKLAARQAVNYLCRMMTALGCLHEAGLRYADLSPDNVMVDQNERIYLVDSSCIDFMGAKGYFVTVLFDDDYQGDSSFYSPEYAAEKMCDHLSDVYSMGVMIKYLMFDHSDARSYLNVHEYENLLLVIEDATQRRPERRLQSMQMLMMDFCAALPERLIVT